jgi:hypothetical protein
LGKIVEESICVLVGERGRKVLKHCIIRSLDIFDPRHIFEGNENEGG